MTTFLSINFSSFLIFLALWRGTPLPSLTCLIGFSPFHADAISASGILPCLLMIWLVPTSSAVIQQSVSILVLTEAHAEVKCVAELNCDTTNVNKGILVIMSLAASLSLSDLKKKGCVDRNEQLWGAFKMIFMHVCAINYENDKKSKKQNGKGDYYTKYNFLTQSSFCRNVQTCIAGSKVIDFSWWPFTFSSLFCCHF